MEGPIECLGGVKITTPCVCLCQRETKKEDRKMGVLTLSLPHHLQLQSVTGHSNIHRKRGRWSTVSSSQQQQQEVCTEFERIKIDKSAIKIQESSSDSELWATSLLRVRSFYDFKSTFGIQVSLLTVLKYPS